MSTWTTRLAIGAAAAAALAGAARADVTLTALSSFSGWTVTSLSGGGTQIADIQTPVGSTGVAVSPTTFNEAYLDTALTYDPATQGAILSISASVDDSGVANTTSALTFRPVIFQDGGFYDDVARTPGPNGAFALTGLTATDFHFVGGVDSSAGHPDFAGDPMTLGVVALFNVPDTGAPTYFFSNLTFTIHSVDIVGGGGGGGGSPTAVPEPRSWALMIGGFAGCGALLRRRRMARGSAMPVGPAVAASF